MALATQGFNLSALPSSPQVPTNLGVVNPVDPAKVLALVRANMETQRAQQAQDFGQAEAIRSQTSQLQTAAQNRALSAQQGQREQEAFTANAPVRSLASQQATLEQSRLGPENTTTETVQNADGTFTTITKKTSNSVPVASSSATTPFATGKPTEFDQEVARLPTPEAQQQARAIHAGLAPKAESNIIRYTDQTGAVHVGAIDKVTGKVRDATAADFNSSNGQAAPIVGVGPSLAQKGEIAATTAANTLTAKADAEKTQAFPTAVAKAQADDVSLQDSERAINQALALLQAHPDLITGYAQNVKIKGNLASQFDALLQTIKSGQFTSTLNSIRGANGNTGIGRVLQSEVPFLVNRVAAIDPVLNPQTLMDNLRYVAERAPQVHEYFKQAFNESYKNQLGAANPNNLAPWMQAAQPAAPAGAGGGADAYASPDAVKAAFASGKISAEQAHSILRSNFGFTD